MVDNIKFDKLKAYKLAISIILGIISFIGIFYSIRIEFNGTSINFALSLMLPMLVALAWGWKYGLVSISLGLVFIYPFILGPYNGWASLVPSLTLFIWIGLHGWGTLSRIKKRTIWNNMFTLQLIHIIIKLLLYPMMFQPLLKVDFPFTNTEVMEDLGLNIIMIFAIKGVIVDSILLAISDSILLMTFIRRFFKLKIHRGSRYNTPVLIGIVSLGMIFTLLIMLFNNLFINHVEIWSWLRSPDDGSILTLSLSLILFIVMAGITVRYLQKNQESRIKLEKRNRQYLQVIEKINKMNIELESLVDKRTEELQHAVKEMEEFSLGVSHDLKSPIRAIDAYSIMLLEDNPDIDVKSRDMLNNIKKHCSGMISLIDKILEYSRLSNKKIELEEINIRETVEELINEYKLASKDREVNFNVRGKTIYVTGDKVLIKDAIGNIISNAVKYTRGRKPALIVIELKETDNCKIVEITDNGIGFDMKHSEKIFKIFQRLHSQDEYEGTGIGLTLARKIVENHNGIIEIDSVRNQGTKVEIIFKEILTDHAEEKKEKEQNVL